MVGVGGLVERLRGLTPLQFAAAVDLAKSVDGIALGDHAEGQERVRREFGISG